MNFADTLQRSGNYLMTQPLPLPLGAEAAGTVVALPTDPVVLEDAAFKARGLKIGSSVVAVRFCFPRSQNGATAY